MKVILILAVLASVVAAATAPASPAATRATACGYLGQNNKIMMIVTGSAKACVMLNRSFHGVRRYTRFGTVRCVFSMDAVPSILVGYFTKDRLLGLVWCDTLEQTLRTWTRVY